MDAAFEILTQDPLTEFVFPIFFAAVAIEALWSYLGNRGL